MMSFAAFKYHALDAFSGEPVHVKVGRVEQRWSLTVQSFDKHVGISVGATAETCPTPAAVRALCLKTYRSLVEYYAANAPHPSNLCESCDEADT